MMLIEVTHGTMDTVLKAIDKYNSENMVRQDASFVIGYVLEKYLKES